MIVSSLIVLIFLTPLVTLVRLDTFLPKTRSSVLRKILNITSTVPDLLSSSTTTLTITTLKNFTNVQYVKKDMDYSETSLTLRSVTHVRRTILITVKSRSK
jgi:hypothetical protein